MQHYNCHLALVSVRRTSYVISALKNATGKFEIRLIHVVYVSRSFNFTWTYAGRVFQHTPGVVSALSEHIKSTRSVSKTFSKI